MKKSALEPAKSIIELLGGEAVVSEITGTAFTAPYRWQASVEKGGTGGLIPQKHIPALLAYAKAKNLGLDANSFLPAEEAAA